ncbi:PRTRC genetic system protein E [Paraburkholderia terricola]|uniref:PRTRC system protein E n=1 Tax=Paraburkholderia terricola TaxID=169427 RepID=UPI0028571240|nr:PRTRC system protein E [Paraburkholderia terricola]MDR6493572.1 PRTRC genetic system protein E [Paraburkholderia terricola]
MALTAALTLNLSGDRQMSLFASLYPLAQKTTLTLLITAEGDKLRVNVTPRAKDDVKGEKTLYPLSILATPDDLDRDFAEAVAIYEPSTQSVLDQARAASVANGATKSTPELPAPTATRGKPGRKARSESNGNADAGKPPATNGANAEELPPVDPRQTSIPGIESDACSATPHQPTTDGEATAAAEPTSVAAGADAVDLF